jgi:hypothetical protein
MTSFFEEKTGMGADIPRSPGHKNLSHALRV